MDSIHLVAKKPWIKPDRLSLKDLVAEKIQLISEHNLTLDGSNCEPQDGLEEKLKEFISQDEKRVRPCFLFNTTDERALTREPECKLKLYEKQLEHAQRIITDRSYKINYLSRLKTTRRETLMRHSVLTNRQEELLTLTSDSTQGLAMLLVVQVWPQPKKTEKLKLDKEILFKSDQCLTDLRDQLKCHRDFANPMDLSENPEEKDPILRGELFKSGLFLIENTFYNDMRDVNNIDMSEPIIRWASEQVAVVDKNDRYIQVSRGVGPFIKARMEETHFEDLIIRLGYPYLYLHQGNCEHLFCISDIRYVQDNKRLRLMKFPYVTAPSFGRKEDSLKCNMCKIGPPHWYTQNNSRLPVDPFFFCQGCFKAFNYDKSNKKIGNFRAYLWNWPGQDNLRLLN